MNVGDKVKVEFEGVLRHKDEPGRVLFVADLKYGESYAVRPDMVRPQVSVTAHTPPKFESGQRVRILDGRKDKSVLWIDRLMNKTIGKVGVICSFYFGDSGFSMDHADVSVGENVYTYRTEWLEALKRGRPKGSKGPVPSKIRDLAGVSKDMRCDMKRYNHRRQGHCIPHPRTLRPARRDCKN